MRDDAMRSFPERQRTSVRGVPPAAVLLAAAIMACGDGPTRPPDRIDATEAELTASSDAVTDAASRIATQLDRPWPIPAQETIGYAPPVPDGERLYLRGEAYLYCIAKD